MKNSILVIEQPSSSISVLLKCDKIEYNNQSKDEDIHSWLISNKKYLSAATKLIIPVRLGNDDAEYMGLYIGLHIRLTRELGAARLLPILFITDDTKEEILTNQINNHKEKSGLLLFTKGSYLLSAFSLDEYISKTLLNIDENTLLELVIPSLNIENKKDPGHQLANDWGAFRLAKFAGCSISLKEPTSLYFKYKDSFTNNEITPSTNTIIGLLNESCKAVLIDDNADSGWSEILKYILKSRVINPGKTASLDVITSFDVAIKNTSYPNYDIVFLDLRLLKEEDRINKITSIEDFSGTKILKVIKEINPGTQVIIFTASNKVWNIEKLLQLGASGYYIKESPEYILSTNFSKENYNEFIKTIKRCLSRKPLKEIYLISYNIKSILSLLVKEKKIDKNFAKSIVQYIDLANRTIDTATMENDFAMGYLVLFKCIEIIDDEYVIQSVDGNWDIKISGPLKQYKFDTNSQRYLESSPINFRNGTPTTFERIAGLGLQTLQLSDKDIHQLYFNILRRNNFIHPSEESALSEKNKLEVKKIYNYEGYLLMIRSLLKIIEQLQKFIS